MKPFSINDRKAFRVFYIRCEEAVLLSFTCFFLLGSHSSLRIIDELYRVVPSCTELYRVLPSVSRAKKGGPASGRAGSERSRGRRHDVRGRLIGPNWPSLIRG